MRRFSFTLRDRLSQNRQASTLKFRITNSMLQDQPSSVASLFTNHRFTGPSKFLNDGLKLLGVTAVDFRHLRRVTTEQLPGRG